MNQLQKLNKIKENPKHYKVQTIDGKIRWDGWNRPYGTKILEEFENFVFENTLIFENVYSGGARFHLKEDFDILLFMFHAEFDELIKEVGNVLEVTGKFTFTKRNKNFGIKYYK